MNLRILIFLVLLLGICASAYAEADTLVGGPVSGHWYAAIHDYYLTRSCTVAVGTQLIIDPGVVVHVNSGGRFVVNGRLVAGGASARTAISADGSAWKGIQISGSFDDIHITNCDLTVPVAGGDSAVALLLINSPIVYVDNCFIFASSNDNIRLYNSTLTISNSQVNNAQRYNVFSRGSTINASNSTFDNAALRNIYGINSTNVYLTRCEINGALDVSNGDGIRLENTSNSGTLQMTECECSGNERRGAYCMFVSSVTFNYVTFADNGAAGFYAQIVPSIHANRVTMSNNGSIAPGGEGAFCYQSTGNFNSCDFDGNGGAGIQAQSTTGISTSFCNFYNNEVSAITGPVAIADSIIANPAWLPNAHHLRYTDVGSRLINSGDPFAAHDSDRTNADIGHHYHNLNHAPIFITWSPTDTVLSGAWGDQRSFSVTYSDSDATDTVRVKWYLDGNLAGTGPNFVATLSQASQFVTAELNDNKPGGINRMYWHVNVGVEEVVAPPHDFGVKSLYPVPTNGMVTIVGDGVVHGRWQLVDLLGRTIAVWNRTQPAGSWHYSMALPANLPSGRYWIIPPQEKPISLILLK